MLGPPDDANLLGETYVDTLPKQFIGWLAVIVSEIISNTLIKETQTELTLRIRSLDDF